ncbi:MAG: hypothetical protein GY759_13645 [Chloroflexi bacterium]|nr:hypothetical protein [Chloroflexota bacterium]
MSFSASRRTLDRLGTLALALILAVIVWVVSVQQGNPFETATISPVPISVQNLPEDLIFAGSSTFSPVEVRVRAPRSILDNLTPRDFDVVLDLADAQPGRQEMAIIIDPNVTGVDIQGYFPESVIVRLEQRVQKEIPVHAIVVDSPPTGYIASSAIITPTIVLIGGAQSVVDTVRRAEVPVRLLDAREDVRVSDFITLRDRNGSIVTGLDVDPRTVSVMVPIEQQQGFAEKSVLPRVEGQPARNYLVTGVTADPATVTVFGDPDVLAKMPPFVETIPIDIRGATEDIAERVPLIVPETVSVIAAQSVNVMIGIEAVESSLTVTLRPIVQGLGPDLQVEGYEPETIELILHGPVPKLETLTADENIQAVLDLTGLEEGSHELAPILVYPEGITVQTVLPETVQVVILTLPTPTPQPTPISATSTLERFGLPATEEPTHTP